MTPRFFFPVYRPGFQLVSPKKSSREALPIQLAASFGQKFIVKLFKYPHLNCLFMITKLRARSSSLFGVLF